MTRSSLIRLFAITVISFCIFSCHRSGKKMPVKMVDAEAELNSRISSLIEDELKIFEEEKDFSLESDTLVTGQWLTKFYERQGDSPAWRSRGVESDNADTLLAIIHDAESFGLIPNDYHQSALDSLRKQLFDSTQKKFNATNYAQYDFLLTDAFLKLCVHLQRGRFHADSLTLEWKATPADTSYIQLLIDALLSKKIRTTLSSLEPTHEQYQRLKSSLAGFRSTFEEHAWDSLPPIEEDSARFFELLPQRLLQSGDYDTTLTVTDPAKLEKAIKSFQSRHGLIADGKPGKNTVRLLHESAAEHIQHIEMSMERWRWIKQEEERRYVFVNIPSFTFQLVDSDSVVLRSKIICGLPDKQSPELNSLIHYFIIYPFWTVPLSIASKEILPHLKKDTGYLTKHRMEVLDGKGNVLDPTKIKWKKYKETYFPFKLRQLDGDDNTLGILKFIFPNPFHVYLHDTNTRNLFGKEVRALSHGCIRLEKAREFANYLVKDDSLGFSVDSLNAYLSAKQRKTVKLDEPLPIHIRYFTCIADTNGVIFYDDIYKKDEKMLEQLNPVKKASPIL